MKKNRRSLVNIISINDAIEIGKNLTEDDYEIVQIKGEVFNRNINRLIHLFILKMVKIIYYLQKNLLFIIDQYINN